MVFNQFKIEQMSTPTFCDNETNKIGAFLMGDWFSYEHSMLL